MSNQLKIKLTTLEKINKKLSFEEQEVAMNYIANKSHKRPHFRGEDILEYIHKIGIERESALYLIKCCLGFEYIDKLLND